MSDPLEIRRGMGGNHPPSLIVPTVGEITAHLQSTTSELAYRAEALGKMAETFAKAHQTIVNDDQQGQASDVVAQIKAHAKVLEDRRKREKLPFKDGGDAVDGHFKKLQERLGSTATIERAQTAYALEKERKERQVATEAARRAQEEADRLAAEAAEKLGKSQLDEASKILDQADEAASTAAEAAKLAAARPSAHSKTLSDYGVTSSLKENLVIAVSDKAKIPLEYLDFNASAARRAVLDAKKMGRSISIPGVEITWEKKIGNYHR